VINFREIDSRVLEPASAIFAQMGRVMLGEIFLPLASCCEREHQLRQAQSSQSVQWELPPVDRESLQLAIGAVRSVVAEYDKRYSPSTPEAQAWDALRQLLVRLLATMENSYFRWGNA
jgi:hypothetical protein